MIKIRETESIGSIYKIDVLDGREVPDPYSYLEISRNFRNINAGKNAYFIRVKSDSGETMIAMSEQEMLELFSCFLAVQKDYEEHPIREV